MNITQLLRPHILTLQPYTPIVPFEVLSARLGRAPRDILKLDANENPYGPSPRALAALADLEFAHIYPDPESTALRAALAQHTGLPAENLLAGAGADELIDLLLRVFLEPGDGIIDCPPTFGMYAFDAALNAGRVLNIPRRADFSLDVDAIVAAVPSLSQRERGPGGEGEIPKLLFVASPNNPDGSVISDADLRRLLALPIGVVLDEAYIEFHGVEHSRVKWVREHENLVVLRTFSKRAGLAGLRVGYGAFPSALMPHLWKFKQPYNVSVAASTAAIASLADPDYERRIVEAITRERDRLYDLLLSIRYLQPYPSRANFILCRVVGRDARELKLTLERDGILVRYFNRPGLTDCIRISIGKPEHTDMLIEALQRLQAAS
jgi:histidinol-phosphate aminotransferase